MPAHYTPVTRTLKRKAAESLKRETLRCEANSLTCPELQVVALPQPRRVGEGRGVVEHIGVAVEALDVRQGQVVPLQACASTSLLLGLKIYGTRAVLLHSCLIYVIRFPEDLLHTFYFS